MARLGAASSWRRDITAAMARPDIGTAVIITAAACLIIIIITIIISIIMVRLITPAAGTAVVGTEAVVTGMEGEDTGMGPVIGGDRPLRLATQIRHDWRGALFGSLPGCRIRKCTSTERTPGLLTPR
jgi:hypothetical protein